MQELEIVIDRRFRGPPESGNGGYCAGLLAEHLGGAAEVTLRAPPPLDRVLRLELGQGQATLYAGERVIAEGRRLQLELDTPRPPSFEQAQAYAARFAGFAAHVFPECFVCGPGRSAHDGLRIFAGPSNDATLTAAPWIPDASLCSTADADTLRPALAWAAMDCPGYAAAASGATALLGRMAAEVLQLPAVGRRYVVVGWPLGREGRKIHAGTALYDDAGALLGRARQTWIELATKT